VKTVVHLLRHGEVFNPTGILYGRMPGFSLSELGRTMAQRVAGTIADRDIVRVVASPLERAQETAAPLADALGLEIVPEPRVIESSSVFEGRYFGVGQRVLRQPSSWRHLWNPLRPSWGEPYKDVVARMMAAVREARDTTRGHEVVLVSHQLPIWVTRLSLEHRPFVHDPRRRECTLCSLTSLEYDDDRLVSLTYSEPAGDLVPVKDRSMPFSAGGAPAPEATDQNLSQDTLTQDRLGGSGE
jgi:broad specificity phosphatase PhoE